MKKLGFLALVFALMFVSTIHAKSETNKMSLTTTAGKVININITQNGFDFKQFKGKTVLLSFFGPMCPPCIIEMPHLIELQKAHKDDLQIVAVQVQMPMELEDIKAFVKKNNINYPVINLNDAWDIVSFVKANTNWGGQIPFMMMFDKKGSLKHQYMGVVENEKLIKDMK